MDFKKIIFWSIVTVLIVNLFWLVFAGYSLITDQEMADIEILNQFF